jgi:hypothetical protein
MLGRGHQSLPGPFFRKIMMRLIRTSVVDPDSRRAKINNNNSFKNFIF